MSTSPFDVNKPRTPTRWYHEVLAIPYGILAVLFVAVARSMAQTRLQARADQSPLRAEAPQARPVPIDSPVALSYKPR